MKTVTFSGGVTNAAAETFQEVLILENLPLLSGTVTSVSLRTIFGPSAAANIPFTLYLFKTFGGNPNYWKDYGSYLYQTPGNVTYWLNESYIGNVLASGSFTQNLHSGNNVIETDLVLTELGKNTASWAGDVFLALIENASESLRWGNGTASVLTLTVDGGSTIKCAMNGGYADCEMYHAINGIWQPVQPFVAADGTFKEIGE